MKRSTRGANGRHAYARNMTAARRMQRAARGGPSYATVAAAAVGGALVSAAVLTAGFARPAISADTFRQLDLFGEVFEQVHANYVESPDDSLLINGAIDGMLAKLDPHSSYLSADDYEQMQEQTRGSFAGLGIQVVMDQEGDDAGYVKVVSPIDDTPADRAGMQTNDLIVEIDGNDVQGMTLDEAISHLKGPKGTSVSIKVVRDREKEPFPLTLVRDIVRVEAVASRMEGDFGYLRVRTFSERAEDGLRKAIRELEEEAPGGLKGYVLDLRANPGGLLDQGVAVADVFLNGGEIVSTRGRHPKDNDREMGTRGDLIDGKPLIVLINGGSASASEIVAGALQDRNRALLLGTKSFGKGSVQTLFPLQNGLQGALRLTTARYYTPSGRSIQAMGVTPDVLMPVVYPGQEGPIDRPSESDLPGALDVTADETPQQTTSEDVVSDLDVIDEKDEEGGIKPVECPFEEDGTTPKDCQLERALEILADQTTYSTLLASATYAQKE